MMYKLTVEPLAYYFGSAAMLKTAVERIERFGGDELPSNRPRTEDYSTSVECSTAQVADFVVNIKTNELLKCRTSIEDLVDSYMKTRNLIEKEGA